jgi:hypothetical protein
MMTEKQRGFMGQLLRERETLEAPRNLIHLAEATVRGDREATSAMARSIIAMLMNLPKRGR